MTARFLSLLTSPPPGFSGGPVGKRELLYGTVALLAPDCASAYALLEDFRQRVEGLIITVGPPALEQVGPLLWHVAMTAEELTSEHRMLTLALAIIEAGAHFRNESVVADREITRRERELENYRHDYSLATESLCDQVRQLTASENKLQTILDSVDAYIYLKDTEGRYLFVNKAVCDFIGEPMSSVVGADYSRFFDAQTTAVVQDHDQQVFSTGVTVRAEEINTFKTSGVARIFHSTKLPLRREDGSIYALCGISTDITEFKYNEIKLRLAASVFAHSYEGIIIADPDETIVDINPAFTRITGYSHAEAVGQTPALLSAGRHDPELFQRLGWLLREKDSWQGETWSRRKNGEVFPQMTSISRVHDAEGGFQHYIVIFSDISRLKAQEEELQRIAYYDTLTGVPNRHLLAERLTQAVAQTRRSGKFLAVCYLDLDGFKPVNDRYGHAVGDQVLVLIANRLRSILRQEDTIARLGGDEFILLLSGLERPEESRQALERVLETISSPMAVDGLEIILSGSIGVTLYPTDDVDPDALLRHADQAMYLAKDAGRNSYHLFDANLDRQAKTFRNYVKQLREALERREFELYYQPKVDLLDGTVVGAEALIRWHCPDQGLLLPEEFLHYLDGTLEQAVGEWVITSALNQMRLWQSEGIEMAVSVNIGAAHLLQTDFADRLGFLIHPYADLVQNGRLELEVLETAALADMHQAAHTLNACRQRGVRFALDDFGTGYASLAYLRSLPVDTLKIDQSFVLDMLDDAEDMGIVESVVRLANAFQRQVVAEGVETLDHGRALIDLGCHLAQGYGIARPMPAGQIPAWIAQWRTDGFGQKFLALR